MSKHDEVLRRISQIVGHGLTANEKSTSPGPLTNADFDELDMLATHISEKLPVRFLSIVSKGYVREAYKQLAFCQRLERILDVSSQFDLEENVEPTLQPVNEPIFELTKDDKTRIFELTSKLRKIVFVTAIFDQPHKRLLLDRIAHIEYQVEQPKGKLDVLLAGVSEVGETAKKFGDNLKPLVDRFTEIASIGRSRTKAYDQIPAPEEVKQLPAPEED